MGKRFLFQILILLVLICGLVAAGYLTLHSQDVRQRAQESVQSADVNPANVLVFLLDDVDEGTFNLLLSAGKLPNIQSYLINKGVRFTNSFVSDSMCCPSRATLLTGKYSHKTGIFNVAGSESGANAFDQNGHMDDNLATWLDGAGYYTGHIGKVLNAGSFKKTRWSGYDFWRNIEGYDTRPGMYDVIVDNNSTPSYPDIYQTKYIGDRSVDFINNFQASSQSKFFLFNAPRAPHVSYPAWSLSVSNFDTTVKDSAKPSVNDTDPIVAFNAFDHPDAGLDTVQQAVKGRSGNRYTMYTRSSTGGVWTSWQNFGSDSELFVGTGSEPIVAFNAFVHPDVNLIRQHLVRGTPTTGYDVYYRDMTGSNPAWIYDGCTSSVHPVHTLLFVSTG